jgi:hypothetical protein
MKRFVFPILVSLMACVSGCASDGESGTPEAISETESALSGWVHAKTGARAYWPCSGINSSVGVTGGTTLYIYSLNTCFTQGGGQVSMYHAANASHTINGYFLPSDLY